jgi:site-specific recombinase XerD
VTHLRKLMLDELQRRNYAQNTVRAYIHAIEDFARYFHRSPDRLGPEHIREYQVHLFRDCKLSPGTAVPLLCVFSSSRHSDVHIFPITFRFPSVRGGCPQC